MQVKYDCPKCGYTLGPFFQNTEAEIQVGACPQCQSRGPFQVRASVDQWASRKDKHRNGPLRASYSERQSCCAVRLPLAASGVTPLNSETLGFRFIHDHFGQSIMQSDVADAGERDGDYLPQLPEDHAAGEPWQRAGGAAAAAPGGGAAARPHRLRPPRRGDPGHRCVNLFFPNVTATCREEIQVTEKRAESMSADLDGHMLQVSAVEHGKAAAGFKNLQSLHGPSQNMAVADSCAGAYQAADVLHCVRPSVYLWRRRHLRQHLRCDSEREERLPCLLHPGRGQPHPGNTPSQSLPVRN